MSEICDSYSEANASTSYLFYKDSWEGVGQAFSGNGGVLESAKFYLKRSNNAQGTLYAHVWNIMWEFGSSAVPLYNTEPIATSDPVDVADVPDEASLVTFNFSGDDKIILGATTKYCVTLEDETESVHPDYLYMYGDRTSPTHAGNECHKSGGLPWGYDGDHDMIFYIYVAPPEFLDIIGGSGVIPFWRQ